MALVANAEHPIGVPAAWWDNFTDPPGLRAEVIRGELVLSPSPSRAHQRAVLKLALVLAGTCPDGFEIIPDIEWRTDRQGLVAKAPRPDLVVVPVSDGPIDTPPVLAVEVLSPSDRKPLERSAMARIGGKQIDYAESGLRHLMLVSTELSEGPWAQLLAPTGSGWETVAFARAGETFATSEPFAFSFRPLDLL